MLKERMNYYKVLDTNEEVEFNYADTLTLSEKANIISFAEDYVITNGHFHKIFMNPVFDYVFIFSLTDYKSEEEFDKDIEHVLNNTDILSTLLLDEKVNALYFEMKEAYESDIAYITGVNPNNVSVVLSQLINKASSLLDKNFSAEMIDTLKNFQNNNITAKDIVESYLERNEISK